MPSKRPEFPYDSFSSDDPEQRAKLDAFQREYGSAEPDRRRLAQHADDVRAVPNFVGSFERWWLSSPVQAFIAELGATGI